MSSIQGRSTGRWSRLAMALTFGGSIVMGSIAPAFARRGGGGGARASRAGGSAPRQPASGAGRTANRESRSANAGERRENRNANAGERRENLYRNDAYVRRNTYVRAAPRAYVRAPYVYGGRRYYSFHAYSYQAGAVVEQLPPGGEEVTMGDQKYVKFGETYYQPIQKDGKAMYEVVEVK